MNHTPIFVVKVSTTFQNPPKFAKIPQGEEVCAPSDSLSPEWEAELSKRLKEVENGTVECEPFDETLRRAYERIAAIHAPNMAFA